MQALCSPSARGAGFPLLGTPPILLSLLHGVRGSLLAQGKLRLALWPLQPSPAFPGLGSVRNLAVLGGKGGLRHLGLTDGMGVWIHVQVILWFSMLPQTPSVSPHRPWHISVRKLRLSEVT